MGTAITTIARYETSRPPRGKVLAQLSKIAEECGLRELANSFNSALAEELGKMPLGVEGVGPVIVHRNEDEKRWIAALLYALRSPEYAKQATDVKRLLRKPDEEVHKRTAAAEETYLRLRLLLQLAAEGKSAAEISNVLGWHRDSVERFFQLPEIKAGSRLASAYLSAYSSGSILASDPDHGAQDLELPVSVLRFVDSIYELARGSQTQAHNSAIEEKK
jgi:hypothetical protein